MAKFFVALALLVSLASALPWCGDETNCNRLCLVPATVSTQADQCTAYFAFNGVTCDDCTRGISDEVTAANITERSTEACHEPVDNLVTVNPPTLIPTAVDEPATPLVDEATTTLYTTRFQNNRIKIAWQEPVIYHFTDTSDTLAGREVRYSFQGLNQLGSAVDQTQCLGFWDDGFNDEPANGAIDGSLDSSDFENCFTRREISATLSDIYNFDGATETRNFCGAVRNEDDPDFVALTLDFNVNYEEQQATLRSGNPVSRALTFRLPVEMRFPRQINVTTATVRAFSPVNYIAAITEQRMSFVGGDSTDLLAARLDVTLFTDVQWPFDTRVLLAEPITSLPGHVSVASTPQLTTADAACSSTDLNQPPSCSHFWDMQFQLANTNECNFNGAYEVTLETFCMGNVTTEDCALATTDADNFETAVFNFDIVTSDICPEVVENIEVTANAATYIAACADPSVTGVGACTEKVGFLHGQTVYLTAQVTSEEASIQETIFRRCDLIRSDGALRTTQLSDRTWSETLSFDGYYKFTPTAGGAVAFGETSYPRFEMFVNTVDTIVGDGELTPVTFADGTDGGFTDSDDPTAPAGAGGPKSNIMQLGADENASIRIECVIDVIFQNTNERSSRMVTFDMKQQGGEIVFEESASVNTRVAFGGPLSSIGAVTPPPAAGGSGAALSTTTIVYAAIGAVGAISIFTLAVVLARRGRNNDNNDGDLQASSSQANLVERSVSENSSTGGVVQGVTVYV